MLASLAIRDVVLIEKLDLSFDAGLAVLTGETGAGKSILLDSLGLALGQRAEAGLVRAGQAQASVAAAFLPAHDHPCFEILRDQGISAEDELVLRRVLQADGKSRAFINDQPVSVALLKRLGAMLVEVQGQHEQVGLADPATHAGLRHAVGELTDLAPEEGEEDALAAERQKLQQGERRAEAIAAALGELTPRDRRTASPARALREAARALERLPPPNEEAQPAIQALATAQDALSEAEGLLTRLMNETGPDPRRLEQVEERLFALRAAARKHSVPVSELATLLASLRTRLEALDAGAGEVATLQAAEAKARSAYIAAAGKLSAARRKSASALEKALAEELPPLKLDRARLVIDISARDESAWGADGQDRVTFLVATNPGQTPGPLAKIASGGELSRLMLALKVVLARGSPVPTLIFDEVDSGIGGATAAAVGERLARVADRVQVLVVTHSPQVAARGSRHFRVAKQVKGQRAETRVEILDQAERHEELARMLAGEKVTEAARAAARSLLGDKA